MKKERRIYGVITASPYATEQRELIENIVRKAQETGIDIIVISNIYNPCESSDILYAENSIFDLIRSDCFSGFIYITESIINPDVQKLILERLEERKDLPVVAIGMKVPEVTLPHFYFINTDDAYDFECITDHLIENHGYTDIHVLTGYEEYPTSHQRAEGCRRSFENHGLTFSDDKLFFGNFWTNSGREQAEKYASGELPFPQALICCNDYMAYGFLDACLDLKITVPEDIAVIGFEYIRERQNHYPLLTTFQRNRAALGEAAVDLLTKKLDTGEYGDFQYPKGKIITGRSCGCTESVSDVSGEMHDVQIKAMYDFLNLFCQLEHRLTECRTIEEFVECCSGFKFMIRDVNRMYMCLYDNWNDAAPPSENMICYDIMTPGEPEHFRYHDLTAKFEGDPAVYCFSPLFLSKRQLGYVILRFDHPDTYDTVFRNWIKTVSNSLEFLRMKNDILYLTTCQELSEQHDALTGLNNNKGMKKAYKSADESGACAVMLRLDPLNRNRISISKRAYAIREAADIVKNVCESQDLCGRIDDDTFFFLIRSGGDAAFWSEHLHALFTAEFAESEYYDIDTFVCCAADCGEMSYKECVDTCRQKTEKLTAIMAGQRSSPHCSELIKIKKKLYREPEITFDSEDVYALFNGSKGYFRQVYKTCFGITLHDDCTAARICHARHCLAMTNMSLSDIADHCGYRETKYFMRQFQQETGFTPSQYRKMTR